jgi:hypothetical protein
MKRDNVHTYLACKGNWWLIQSLLLGVPDVGGDNLVKWKSMVLLLELFAQKLRLDGELAANSILNFLKSGVQVVERKLWHCG